MKDRYNALESQRLSDDDRRLVEAAQNALASIAKTFDNWVTVGRAIDALRRRAKEIGGKATFKRLLDQQGFGDINPGTITILLKIIDNLPAVVAWHETLAPKQKRQWGSPSSVNRHCPVFAKDKPPTPPKSPNVSVEREIERLDSERDRLQARVQELEEERDRLQAQPVELLSRCEAALDCLSPLDLIGVLARIESLRAAVDVRMQAATESAPVEPVEATPEPVEVTPEPAP